jgi:hypothetical protein
VLPSVAAFTGVVTGTVAVAIANMAIVKSRMADLFMRFSRVVGKTFRGLRVLPRNGANIPLAPST